MGYTKITSELEKEIVTQYELGNGTTTISRF